MFVKIAIIVVLILAALVFILFEILTTTFGLLTAMTLISLGAAIWQAWMISPTFGVILSIAAVVLMPPYIVLLVRWLPRMPMGKKLFLENVPDSTAASLPETPHYEKLVGQVGIAETLMRPAGAIRVAGRRIPAMAESGVIEKGAQVKVVAAGEQNLVVRRINNVSTDAQDTPDKSKA